jgi:hypothetical protein
MKPDKKLHAQLWSMQRAVPMVVLFGRTYWFIPEFLTR